MLALILILTGVLLRFLPHAPNFTPVAAIAIFSGAYMQKRYAFFIPLALMAISDLILGLHDVVLFTWGGFALVTLIGFWVRKQKTVSRILAGSLGSSLLFFAVSNFGVWLAGWYPPTINGLVNCYIMALPFLRNFIVSTVVYCGVFFGAYELAAKGIRNTKFSKVLLTQ